MATSKPTVNEEDLAKLDKFKEDFGQEGWLCYKVLIFWILFKLSAYLFTLGLNNDCRIYLFAELL